MTRQRWNRVAWANGIFALVFVTGLMTGSLAAEEIKADAADPRFVHLEGRVLDESWRPVAGAEVGALRGGILKTVRTQADGRYRFTWDEPILDSVFLVASADEGRRQGAVELGFEEVLAVRRGNIVLRPSRSVEVTVVSSDGTRLKGAQVALLTRSRVSPVIASGETDANGKVTVRYPADRRVSSALAFKPSEGFDLVHFWGRTSRLEEEEQLGADLSFQLGGATRAEVKVTDEEGKPVVAAVVRPSHVSVPIGPMATGSVALASSAHLPGLSAVTDASGLATIPWMPSNLTSPAEILVTAPGWRQNGKAEYEPGRAKPVDVTLRRLGSAGGRVSRDDGSPVAGVLVWAVSQTSREFHYARTGRDGRWEMPVVKGEEYAAGVDNRAAVAAPSPLFRVADNPVTGIGFRIVKGTLLRGRVTQEPGAQPMARAGVRFRYSTGFWVHTSADDDGRYELLAGPGEGEFLILNQPLSAKIQIGRQETIQTDLNLARNALREAEGRAVDERGKAIANGEVNGRSIGDEGKFKFTYGHYSNSDASLVGRTPDGRLAVGLYWQPKAGEADGAATVVFRPAATLAGRLVDATNAPLADFPLDGLLKLTSPDPRQRFFRHVVRTPVRTDAEGRFVVTGLPTGFRCELWHPRIGTVQQACELDLLRRTDLPKPETADMGTIEVE